MPPIVIKDRSDAPCIYISVNLKTITSEKVIENEKILTSFVIS